MVLDFGQNAFIRSKTICLQQICVTNFNLNFPLTQNSRSCGFQLKFTGFCLGKIAVQQ